MAPKQFAIPVSVTGPADLARLKRTLETFDDALHQASLRTKAGVTSSAVTQPSQLLAELAALNGQDLKKKSDRQALLTSLQVTLQSAPTITMSFAVDPSAALMATIVSWLRANIHPTVLVRVGLQPTIAAGCTLRTPSRLYDFSLRSKFAAQRPLLLERLRDTKAKPVTLVAPTKEAA